MERWILALLATVGLSALCLLTACGQPQARLEEETAIAQMLTIDPDVSLTLTAWPTPPLLLTRPPTPTSLPQPLWIAEWQPSPIPSETAPPPTAPAAATSGAQAATVEPAAPGTMPLPVRLVIPNLDLDVAVVELSWDIILEDGSWRSVWQTADMAAGHHRDSANPGEKGNIVISGHHNSNGEVFRQVSEIGQPGSNLGIGDEIILESESGQNHTYVVTDWDRFQEEGISIEEQRQHNRYLDPTDDATLTLVTCWPYQSNTYRVVVVAKLQY